MSKHINAEVAVNRLGVIYLMKWVAHLFGTSEGLKSRSF